MGESWHREMGSLLLPMTSFVGRQEATAEVRRALRLSRLVTLTGVGGVGKSRLAVHVAQELWRAFPDSVWLVELAKVQDPSQVPEAVAAALGLLDQSLRDPETVLVEYLADKGLLLLLDNCEHVLTTCGDLAYALLAAAPGVRVLATSREPLGVAGESIWPVPPLSVRAGDGPLPSGTARRYEAVALFEERAVAVRPGFTVNPDNEVAVARLCQRLDGVPLAIELAAARLRSFSVEEILDLLEHRFSLLTRDDRAVLRRHQTLRAAVDWSFESCSEAERVLWVRCSVFAGEFNLDAAESICSGDGLAVEDVFAGVAGLVDKSILTSEQRGARMRYRMLETIRQYGQERLREAGEQDVLRRRHRDYYLGLAERADAESAGPRQGEWFECLRVERANMWAALDYCATTPGEARTGLRMGAALWVYWVACGFVHDGRYWLDRALAVDTAPSVERARALWINGWIATLQGDHPAALTLLDECRDLAQQLRDETELTYAIQFLASANVFVNDLPHAKPLLEEALARQRGSSHWTGPDLIIFAVEAAAAVVLGDLDFAKAMLNEARALSVPLGERWALSWTMWQLGIAWLAAGDPDKACEYLCDALHKKYELNDQLGIPFCVEGLAWVAAATGDWDRAGVLFGALERMWEPIGRPLFGSKKLIAWSERIKIRCRQTLGDHAYESASRRGAHMTHEEIINYTRTLACFNRASRHDASGRRRRSRPPTRRARRPR